MMSGSMRWTPEQQHAIQASNDNLLVAAAAGSGKTAVLVERIIQKVVAKENPLDLDRLLVVTFTEAAALEMRNRIGNGLAKALEKHPTEHLRKQIALLNKAQISTLHSFCLSVVRRYFFELGLDPDLTVMGENESLLLKQEVLEQVLEEHYVNGSEAFYQLAEVFGGQGQESLGEQVLRLEGFLKAMPFPEQWLEKTLKFYEADQLTTLENMPWYRELLQMISMKVELAVWYHRQAMALASRPGGPGQYLTSLQGELEALETFLAACRRQLSWDELRTGFCIEFNRLPSIRKTDNVDQKLKEQAVQLRDAAKKEIQNLKQFLQRSEDELAGELRELGPPLRQLVDLVKEFDRAYQKAKQRKGQLDFNDLEHYCIKLLCEKDDTGNIRPSRLAEELRQQYREIMVDEYQDINDVQETIIKMLTGGPGETPHLFMVGDVKQSIYGFRMANPGLFLEKYLSYSQEEGSSARKILLSANFRCRKEVVDGVNHIFRRIMVSKTGELDYDREAELIYKANYAEAEAGTRLAAGPVELHLVDSGSEATEEETTALEKEARLIAYRIRQLLGQEGHEPARVWDKNSHCYRPIKCKDIVILLRSTRDKANVFLDALQSQGLPAYAELGTGYFQATEISIMLSLLKIIDNPHQDIPLVAVLRSPLWGLNANQLAAVRAASPYGSYWRAVQHYIKVQPDKKLAEVLKSFSRQLDSWRTVARQGPLSGLIWQIYQDTAFLDYAAAMPGGRQRKANLYALYDRAREFDTFSRHGLFRFLRFIEKLQETDEDLGLAGAFGESDDVVRIMSIHKSKGLEFPVVFVANLGGKFNLKDLNRDLLLHRDFGLASLYYDLKLRVKFPTAPYRAIRNALRRNTLAEELRILYVALTRAREKLILVGSVKEPAQLREQWQQLGSDSNVLPLPVLATAGCYLDWLGPAVAGAGSSGSNSLFSMQIWGLPDGKDLPGTAISKRQDVLPWNKIKDLQPFAEPDPAWQKQLDRNLGWSYPASAATEKPAKLSATEVKRRLQEKNDEAPSLLFHSQVINSRPRFLQEMHGLSGAELGTAVHMVMQHLDFKAVDTREAIMKQIEAMVDREFLTEEQAQAVGWKQFLSFFQSPLGRRLREANKEQVRREVPFTLSLPAEEVYRSSSFSREERVIVQGIIDCLLIEEDGIVVIDYKTDKIRRQDLPGRVEGYRHQLALYARAVEEIFQLPVKNKYLYFFQLAEIVTIS